MKSSYRWLPLLSIVTVALVGCGGNRQESSPTQAAGTAAVDQDSDGVVTESGVEKVTICHIPPGNPDNAHTITVGAPAVPAHLAHGDSIGPCATPSPTPAPTPTSTPTPAPSPTVEPA